MSTVVMAISGVLYALMILQMPFVIVMTGIGVITLAGVVVNNAIVLIDYVDMLRSRDGYELRAALIKAGAVRLRPVLLTAITTVLGLVPLAIGFNLDFLTLFTNPVLFFTDLGTYLYWGGEQAAWWAPMAVSVIAGLSFSTVLTLVFVPTVYLTLDKVVRSWNRTVYGIQKGLPSAHGSIEKTDVQPIKEADILDPILN
jgi:multidrug efflux pump subunit AcrB